jgi:[acyl-carrier-protein] S-malonyltransferase
MNAYIFPGQGSQFQGMGKELYERNAQAKELFETANEILEFRISDIMFSGTDEDLKQTRITQPAVFLHSVILAKTMTKFEPDMVAGHSLGEFSALVANGTLEFEDALKLVYKRAFAMQKTCESEPGTMAAILGLEDQMIVDICASVKNEVVVAANFNCPGQVVISGSMEGVRLACEKLKEAGAKRALLLPVGGAFHSPLMEPARKELEAAIVDTPFNTPLCPVYQNVSTVPLTDVDVIRKNLIAQLTAPVKWTQSIRNMFTDGATIFTEIGPGKVLQGLMKKLVPEAEVGGLS